MSRKRSATIVAPPDWSSSPRRRVSRKARVMALSSRVRARRSALGFHEGIAILGGQRHETFVKSAIFGHSLSPRLVERVSALLARNTVFAVELVAARRIHAEL